VWRVGRGRELGDEREDRKVGGEMDSQRERASEGRKGRNEMVLGGKGNQGDDLYTTLIFGCTVSPCSLIDCAALTYSDEK